MRLGLVALAPWRMLRAWLARRYARRHGLDMAFADFGIRLGWRLLRHRPRDAQELLLVPVHDIRFWEFGFVWPRIVGNQHLDVSSPRLLSLRYASENEAKSITIINPDKRDSAATTAAAQALGLSNISVQTIRVADLRDDETFDSIWSISVVEHILEDGAAISQMWSLVRPGGRLLVTVPVDRVHWDEYRDSDVYELSRPAIGPVFFQRFYTESTIGARLLSVLAGASIELSWWGEAVQGTFLDHVNRWRDRGFDETVNDPRLVADEYRAFETWSEMPGFGVCGIAATKSV